MSESKNKESSAEMNENKKDILRVALDPKATRAFNKMAEALKEQNQFLKFHPSELVSFIIADYAESYFKSDIDVLVAAFFDYHAFMKAQTEKAKDQENFMEVMQQALEESKKIRSKLNKSVRISMRKKKEYESAPTGHNT